MSFNNKTAIVTGTTGIGRAVAQLLARQGACVFCCGIDEAANQSLAKAEDGRKFVVRTCDVSQPEQVQAAVEAAVLRFGGLDIIVNAAAVHPYGNAVDTEIEIWDRCLSVNVTAVYLFAHFGIPELKKRGGGAIVNLASVQGYACQQNVAAYATSKGAIHSLTRALAVDHAGDKIRVNSVSPGSVATPMLEQAARTFSPEAPQEEVFARFAAAHPLGRIGTPEEIAELVLFLASDQAGFCTGADYVIDGGLKAGLGVR